MNHAVSPVNALTISRRLTTFLHAALFFLGFALVFIVGWGGAAPTAGHLFGQNKTIIGQIGDVVVIVFGLVTLGVVKTPWLFYDTRPEWNPNRWNGWISSGIMGVFFAAC